MPFCNRWTQRGKLKAFNCNGRIAVKYDPHPLQSRGQIVPKISNGWMKSTRAAPYTADVMLCWSRPRMFAVEPCSPLNLLNAVVEVREWSRRPVLEPVGILEVTCTWSDEV